ncbi:MAG: NINE protein [Psychroflexus halocasei]
MSLKSTLWLVLGFLAGHRWYAGKPFWINILYIVTLDGLGVWAIIDVINILTDNF